MSSWLIVLVLVLMALGLGLYAWRRSTAKEGYEKRPLGSYLDVDESAPPQPAAAA